jgi:hypothetical protein
VEAAGLSLCAVLEAVTTLEVAGVPPLLLVISITDLGCLLASLTGALSSLPLLLALLLSGLLCGSMSAASHGGCADGPVVDVGSSGLMLLLVGSPSACFGALTGASAGLTGASSGSSRYSDLYSASSSFGVTTSVSRSGRREKIVFNKN